MVKAVVSLSARYNVIKLWQVRTNAHTNSLFLLITQMKGNHTVI